jgi:hypothetical protein
MRTNAHSVPALVAPLAIRPAAAVTFTDDSAATFQCLAHLRDRAQTLRRRGAAMTIVETAVQPGAKANEYDSVPI